MSKQQIQILRKEIAATERELDKEQDPVRRTALNEDLNDLRHELWCARQKHTRRFSDWDETTIDFSR
jgi:hypothetical protein